MDSARGGNAVQPANAPAMTAPGRRDLAVA
jgi:hypothetical protein